MNLINLLDATDPALNGGKAARLAGLVRAGLPVPPGFVVPTTAYREALASALTVKPADSHGAPHVRDRVDGARLPARLVNEIASALDRLASQTGTQYVAVRSSATSEDGEQFSAAGQHATVLGARGADEVSRAVVECWASLWDERAVDYRGGAGGSQPEMAVLVQALIDADAAGVMFTGVTTTLEAAWGLGESVVSGQVTPDRWLVRDQEVVARELGRKTSRTDLVGDRLAVRTVDAGRAQEWCLRDDEVLELSRVGHRVGAVLDRERLDVEWARSSGRTWVLQARPVTAGLVAPRTETDGSADRSREPAVLVGVAASPGSATGRPRIVRGPSDFASVRPGDVVICRHTDPAWTPLFTIASAVVTEAGGVLSHPAIVAREVGIPAVVGAEGAVDFFEHADWVVVDGDVGTVRRD